MSCFLSAIIPQFLLDSYMKTFRKGSGIIMLSEHYPAVSVIIPIYNIESFLPRCLDSLSRQTLSEIEILCVDDGSVDTSRQIVEQYKQRDSRIHLLLQKHQGVSKARNTGIHHARGKYISFIDGDDWCEPIMLETMWKKAEESQCDLVVSSAQVHFLSQNFMDLWRRRSLKAALDVETFSWQSNSTPAAIWRCLEQPGSWPFVWNKLILKELLIDNDLEFAPELSLGEDGALIQLIFQYVKRIEFISEPLYHYRYQRKASATERLITKRSIRFEHHCKVIVLQLYHFSQRNILKENGTFILRWVIQFLYADFLMLPEQMQKKASFRLNELFQTYDMESWTTGLTRMEQRRLSLLLTESASVCKSKRAIALVQMKVENKIKRSFYDPR